VLCLNSVEESLEEVELWWLSLLSWDAEVELIAVVITITVLAWVASTWLISLWWLDWGAWNAEMELIAVVVWGTFLILLASNNITNSTTWDAVMEFIALVIRCTIIGFSAVDSIFFKVIGDCCSSILSWSTINTEMELITMVIWCTIWVWCAFVHLEWSTFNADVKLTAFVLSWAVSVGLAHHDLFKWLSSTSTNSKFSAMTSIRAWMSTVTVNSGVFYGSWWVNWSSSFSTWNAEVELIAVVFAVTIIISLAFNNCIDWLAWNAVSKFIALFSSRASDWVEMRSTSEDIRLVILSLEQGLEWVGSSGEADYD